MVEHKPLPKLQRFVGNNWLRVIQAVAWIVLSYASTSRLAASGWLPAFESDPIWWWLKGMAVCGMELLVVIGASWIIETVVTAWREA